MSGALRVLLIVTLMLAGRQLLAAEPDDRYLSGYVAALLEHKYEVRGFDVAVVDGVLRIDPGQLPEEQREAILIELAAIEGLRVETAAAPDGQPSVAAPSEEREEPLLMTGLLPAEATFRELLADPRWPRFSASLQSYLDDEELGIVGSANFGGTLPVYGWEMLGGIWQVGGQAGVFSIFDLEAESSDLVNADFIGGAALSARYDQLSGQARLYHQSSHLGDEFLLRNRTDRINLSFEAIDLLVSYAVTPWLRLYGGGGVLVRTDPEDLEEWSAQGGLELTSPRPVVNPQLYPLLAFDFQTTEENDWDGDYSVRGGLEVRNPLLEGRRLQLMLEYFNGHSPNGQFFERTIEYVGTGVYFYF